MGTQPGAGCLPKSSGLPRLAGEPEELRELELAREAGVSFRRWNGWEAKRTTTVTAWTEDGRPAQWVTETEPEYDVNERDNWHALAEYRDALCPQCKRLRSVCENDDQPWWPQRHVCHATAAQQNALRAFHDLHKDARPNREGYLPTDGHTIWVADRDLTPTDDFLGVEQLPSATPDQDPFGDQEDPGR